MKKKITIGSRGSKLALLYAQKVKEKIIEVTNFIDQDINCLLYTSDAADE